MVSGFVYRDDDAIAAYLVQWTIEGVDLHGANFDLIIGNWGERATRSERSAIAVEFRHTPDGRAFMVGDASARPVGQSDLVGHALSREEVVGTPMEQVVFEIVDAVWLYDSRISEIVKGAG